MARTKSVIMSKEETKAALAAAKLDLKELKVTQKTIAAERKTLDKDHAVAVYCAMAATVVSTRLPYCSSASASTGGGVDQRMPALPFATSAPSPPAPACRARAPDAAPSPGRARRSL